MKRTDENIKLCNSCGKNKQEWHTAYAQILKVWEKNSEGIITIIVLPWLHRIKKIIVRY